MTKSGFNGKIILKTVLFLSVLVLILIWRCTYSARYYSITGFTQGTTYHITYEIRGETDLKPEVDSILNDFDHSLSTYIPNSVISEINRNVPGIEADEHFIKVFNKSYEVYLNTDGAFDITVAPIVNALGFGFTKKVHVDSALIDSLLQYVGMNKVKLSGKKVIKQFPETMFDVNAIAQGYSVDVVSAYFDKLGIKNYLIEIGGEIRTKGRNSKKEDWKIGIDKPIENNMIPGESLQTILKLTNKSLATSGNYRKFYEEDGVKYAHSIDPKTGYPVLTRLLSATVVANDCMTADAYATAFMVMGLEKSIDYLSKHKELQGYLIFGGKDGNFETYITEGLRNEVME